MNRREQERLLREVMQAMATGRNGGLQRTVTSMLRRRLQRLGLGGLGEIASIVLEQLINGRRITERDLERALRTVLESGYVVTTPGAEQAPPRRRAGAPPIVRPPNRPGEPPIVRPGAPNARPAPPRGPASPAEPPQRTSTSPRSRRSTTRTEDLPWADTRRVRAHEKPGDPDLLPEIQTPESSNVFSFRYDTFGQILYVTYKAPGPVTKRTKNISVCSGKEATVGHRPHIRGAMYAYGGAKRPVPRHVYDSMVRARSKGKFVWSHLRVCGTIHGHQYPYRLVQGALVGPNRTEIYVPRKATARGFRVRTVPMVGTGRRGGIRSTRPERLF